MRRVDKSASNRMVRRIFWSLEYNHRARERSRSSIEKIALSIISGIFSQKRSVEECLTAASRLQDILIGDSTF